MRFIDEAKIKVIGGHGGRGCVSFWREKFVARGGPDGGDGGDGGAVIFVASTRISTLQDLRYKRTYQAPNGEGGSGANKAGRDGEDIEVLVPIGTMLKDFETSELIFDFTEEGQRFVVAKGGRGGKGNAHFVTSTYQAPRHAQPGEDGAVRELKVELKLLADVGLVGYPNAGKSTLISRISAAHPKIADYPFTTLVPNLGVVFVDQYQSFVVADVPGLIEGAHRGAGLGTRFLKHLERTRSLVHLLDGTHLLEFTTRPDDETGAGIDKAVEELERLYGAIRNELELFNPDLAQKEEVIVINKADLFAGQPDFLPKVIAGLEKKLGKRAYAISCASGEGTAELVSLLWRMLHP